MTLATLLLPFSLLVAPISAAVTIYTSIPGVNAPLTTSTAPFAQTTENSAYSSLVLTPPDPPGGLQTTVNVNLNPTGGMPGLSTVQRGNFLGFSVELSVADQVLGRNSTFLNPIFLNYMANIRERIGMGPIVRVGGNTQDESFMFADPFIDAYGHPKMIEKYYPVVNGNPTYTPNINFGVEVLYTMANISSLLDIDWYFGIQFNQPYNDSNAMWVAKTAEDVLGDHLVAIQVGNEPDLYAGHLRRPSTYGIPDYLVEFQHVMDDLSMQGLRNNKIVLGPSVCCAWTNQQVFEAGYLTQFANYLKIIASLHYPNNNCQVNGNVINPQDIFANYLTHKAADIYKEDFLETAQQVTAAGYPFVILETNTASCGGFPGLSDSFGAALWGIDNALGLTTINTTTTLLHVGGQHDSYNPFTPPPTNMTKDHQWTTGAIYYSTLAVAETLGRSNASQVVDLNFPSEYQPGYAVYENGSPTRLAIVNFVDDASGASDMNVVYSLNGATVPESVKVRYLLAPTVSEKFNITWAGQTMGGMFQSDGRLMGEENTITIPCDAAANHCIIPVKAPSFALVFLTDEALANSSPASPTSTLTFATTAFTGRQHVLVDPSILVTMNGDGGGPRHTGSTSKNKGASSGGLLSAVIPALSTIVALAFGCMLVVYGGRA